MVIDPDYRGSIQVGLYNDSDEVQVVPAGTRIAQLLILPYVTADFAVVDELDKTERGDGGFGSTGTK